MIESTTISTEVEASLARRRWWLFAARAVAWTSAIVVFVIGLGFWTRERVFEFLPLGTVDRWLNDTAAPLHKGGRIAMALAVAAMVLAWFLRSRRGVLIALGIVVALLGGWTVVRAQHDFRENRALGPRLLAELRRFPAPRHWRLDRYSDPVPASFKASAAWTAPGSTVEQMQSDLRQAIGEWQIHYDRFYRYSASPGERRCMLSIDSGVGPSFAHADRRLVASLTLGLTSAMDGECAEQVIDSSRTG